MVISSAPPGGLRAPKRGYDNILPVNNIGGCFLYVSLALLERRHPIDRLRFAQVDHLHLIGRPGEQHECKITSRLPSQFAPGRHGVEVENVEMNELDQGHTRYPSASSRHRLQRSCLWGPVTLSLGVLTLLLCLPAFADDLPARFLSPPPEAAMGTYWVWFGPAVAREGIDRDLVNMKQAHISGAVLLPVYPLSADDPTNGIR